MKLVIALNLLVMVSLAAGFIRPTLYNSIDEFKRTNPGTKLMKMKVVDAGPTVPRTYYIGQRQTGEHIVTSPEQIPLACAVVCFDNKSSTG
jgi:hypothetical protein